MKVRMSMLTAKCERLPSLSEKKVKKFLRKKNNIDRDNINSVLSVISKNIKFNQGGK